MADKSMQIPLPAAVVHENLPYSRPPTPHSHALQIGFYGLGAMGYLMARNLATHKISHPVSSPPLLIYNRTVAKSEQLAKELGGEGKVRIAQSAGQLANECDVIITNLANDEVVKAVYTEFSKALIVRIAYLFDKTLSMNFWLGRKLPLPRTRSSSRQALCVRLSAVHIVFFTHSPSI